MPDKVPLIDRLRDFIISHSECQSDEDELLGILAALAAPSADMLILAQRIRAAEDQQTLLDIADELDGGTGS